MTKAILDVGNQGGFVKISGFISICLVSALALAGCSATEGNESLETESSASSEPSVKIYESCSELNLDYLGGVSLPGKKNLGMPIAAEPTENQAVYEANADLETDNDGVICELFEITEELRLAHGIEKTFEDLVLEALEAISFPVDNTPCEGQNFQTGYFQGKFVLLSCGPDLKWHPQFDSNRQVQYIEVDDEFGYPVDLVEAIKKELDPDTVYLATQAIDFDIDPRYVEGGECATDTYGWQLLGKDKNGELAYLRCSAFGNQPGNFYVDPDMFGFDPATNSPKLAAELPRSQRLAYSPHAYILPNIVSATPQTELSNPEAFTDVAPCKVRDYSEAPDKAFGFKELTHSAVLKPGFKIAVLAVDFEDYPAVSTPAEEIVDVEIELTRYYERMSSVPISFEWIVPDEFKRMKKSLGDYELGTVSLGMDFGPTYRPYIQDVIDLYDDEIDFSEIDAVVIEEPRYVPDAMHPLYLPYVYGNGSLRFSSDEGLVKRIMVSGNDELRNIPNWLHEFGHLLGMPDRNWADGGAPGYDIMFGWYGSPEMSIWLRWIFGIATDEQIHCVTQAEPSTHWIRPVAWDGEYVKGLVLPVNSSTVIVVESRKRQGYDVLTAEYGEGAYVYRIDTRAKMYGSDSRVLVDSIRPDRATILQNDWSFDSQLQPGDVVESDGWRIEVLESGDYGEVVRVQKG